MYRTDLEITDNKNVVVLGDFNAAMHARREGEHEVLGPRVCGKGIRLLRGATCLKI